MLHGVPYVLNLPCPVERRAHLSKLRGSLGPSTQDARYGYGVVHLQ